jgi:hypothetical protein
MLAKQALYCLSPTFSPFCSGYFWEMGGLMNYLLGLALSLDPLISASQVARITGVSHQHPASLSHLNKDIKISHTTNRKVQKQTQEMVRSS